MEARDVYGLVRPDRVSHLQRALAERGVGGASVQVHPAAPGRYQLHDETLHADAAAARRGALLGAAVGAAVGLAMTAFTTVGVVAVVGAFAGFGVLVGGMVGLQRVEHHDGDPVGWREVGPDDHVMLVEVHHEHWHNRAHRILERHGAQFLEGPAPV